MNEVPDFFQEDGETALRQQARWLDANLGVDTPSLAKMLRAQEADIANWKRNKTAGLPNGAQGALHELWHVVLHLLSHYNSEVSRVRRLLEQVVPEVKTVSPPPLCPPWVSFSLKSYMESGGVEAINQVDRWLMGLRFGDPYASPSANRTPCL